MFGNIIKSLLLSITISSATSCIKAQDQSEGIHTTVRKTHDEINLSNQFYCYKNPVFDQKLNVPVKNGFTALKRSKEDASIWPAVRQSAWLALEAKTKGFVVNRLAFEDIDNNPDTPTTPVGIPVANFVEGMMVYDTVADCLKIYNGLFWNCYKTQACPD